MGESSMFHNHKNKINAAPQLKIFNRCVKQKQNKKIKTHDFKLFFRSFRKYTKYISYLVCSIISSCLATWKQAIGVFTLSKVTLAAVRKTLVLKGQRALSPSPSPLL